MDIIVIGLGSMGKRRIGLIKEMYPEFGITGIDGRKDRRDEAAELLGIPCYASLLEVGEKVECAFVCTSPLSHAAIITDCLERGWHVFTELNLVPDGYEKNILLAKEKKRVLFLSSTFLYREEIRYIKSRVAGDNIWNYIYHIGQYLPDWHPWENYKDFFIGDSRTNGCRELMAIELPWLIRTFGKVKRTQVLADKMTGLSIDYRDNYMIQIEHENGNKGVLIIDVVSPVAVRKLEVYGEHRYIQWNGTPDSLREYNAEKDELEQVVLQEIEEHRDGYRAFVVENAYKNEIREFMETVMNGRQPQYGFVQDLEILKLIDTLEEQG